jgi:hypothetical protein
MGRLVFGLLLLFTSDLFFKPGRNRNPQCSICENRIQYCEDEGRVKPSSNEWVTFIVFIRVFLHLRSLLQAPEIRNAQMEQQNRQRKLEGKD